MLISVLLDDGESHQTAVLMMTQEYKWVYEICTIQVRVHGGHTWPIIMAGPEAQSAIFVGPITVCQPNHLKANRPRISDHFYCYLFNSRRNMHVNLDYLISMHPKKAILPTFSGKTPHFQGKRQETRTNNLHHQKADSVAFCFSLRLGVHHKQTRADMAQTHGPPRNV